MDSYYSYGANENIVLLDIVDSENADLVFEEVCNIFALYYPSFPVNTLKSVFDDIVDLYKGNYSGYRKCTTEYHNLTHVMETFLAMARLIHGYCVDNKRFTEKQIFIGLVSALMHDTGYIQAETETSGTGAVFTLTHISRSIIFMEKYFNYKDFSQEDMNLCGKCILCTNANSSVDDIDFKSSEEKTLGKMLAVADIEGQIAHRSYLENLSLLFDEFTEGKVIGFENETDLYEKTVDFFTFVNERFEFALDRLDKYMATHFQIRLNTHEDLYKTSIEKNAAYLKYIVNHKSDNIANYLRRK